MVVCLEWGAVLNMALLMPLLAMYSYMATRAELATSWNPRLRLHTHAHTHARTHTHPFNGPLSGTTQLSQHQKGKTNLDFTGARDSEWQWHQLGHMQVCTTLQTDNRASTSLLSFYRAMLCIRGTSHGPVSVCVRLSVTSRSSTKTAKHRITQTTPHDTPKDSSFLMPKMCAQFDRGHPLQGRRMQVGWVRIGDFWLITGFISKTVQDRHILPIKVE